MSSPLLRVLVVDDEFSVRVSLGGYLEDRGFEVLSAGSAEEALEALAIEPADVAIVDIRLPGMDGNALIPKAAEMQPSLKFLIYTGSAAYHLPRSLADIGIGSEDIFRKPLSDLDIIAKAVRRLAKEGSYDGIVPARDRTDH